MPLVPDWLQTIECHRGTRKELPAPVMIRRRQSGDSLLSRGENGARRLRVNAELSLDLYSILSTAHTIFGWCALTRVCSKRRRFSNEQGQADATLERETVNVLLYSSRFPMCIQ